MRATDRVARATDRAFDVVSGVVAIVGSIFIFPIGGVIARKTPTKPDTYLETVAMISCVFAIIAVAAVAIIALIGGIFLILKAFDLLPKD